MIGSRGGTHIGGCLEKAAAELQLKADFLESGWAMEAPAWLRIYNWRLRGRRPTRLKAFGERVLEKCRQWRPHLMVSTGAAPLEKSALCAMGLLRIQRVNYSTDDPWNPVHRAPWFLRALPFYDHVFSPRKANLQDLKALGCANAMYLPFAYMPEIHHPEPPASPQEKDRFSSDVVFIGSGDRERLPYITALIQGEFRFALYGSFWDRFPGLQKFSRGPIDPVTMRKGVGGARVALCLVRRANRDGHSMRSFEIPAIGACMLTEDTEEHREIFGEEGQVVVYFRTPDEMVKRLRWLLSHDEERLRLAGAAHELITKGGNTYKDRLLTILKLSGGNR